MTPVFCCGAECGILSAGAHFSAVTGSPTISTSTVRNGARSFRTNQTASTGASVVGINTTITAANLWVIRTYIYFATLPTANTALIEVHGPTVDVDGGLYFKSSDNTLRAGFDSTTLGTSNVVVTTGVWYLIDLRVDYSSTTYKIDIQVDTTAFTQFTQVAGSSQTSNEVWLGIRNRSAASMSADVFFDDIVLSNTTGDYPIGAGFVNHFIPTADGTHNIAGTADFQRTLTGTDILNATTTAFQLVDDVPLESGASVDWINMLAPPNATDYVECVFGPASGISTPTVAPRAVEVIAGIHQAATGTGNMEIRINDNGTLNAMYSATTVAGVTSVAYKRKHYAAGPAGAWSIVAGAGNFNNLKVRFGSPAALDVNPDQYFDCIMIEAEFAPLVAPSFIPRMALMGVG